MVALAQTPDGNPNNEHLSDAFLVKVNSCTGSIIADNWILSAAHCFSSTVTNSGYSKKTEYGDDVLDVRGTFLIDENFVSLK